MTSSSIVAGYSISPKKYDEIAKAFFLYMIPIINATTLFYLNSILNIYTKPDKTKKWSIFINVFFAYEWQ